MSALTIRCVTLRSAAVNYSMKTNIVPPSGPLFLQCRQTAVRTTRDTKTAADRTATSQVTSMFDPRTTGGVRGLGQSGTVGPFVFRQDELISHNRTYFNFFHISSTFTETFGTGLKM